MTSRPTAASSNLPTAARLLDVTLELIDKAGGCRGVNLRQIAKRAGCAHTNVYNYHGTFEDLLWAALDQALERLADHTDQRLRGVSGRCLKTFLEAQLDFALAHPGLFRLIWQEPLGGRPPERVLARVAEMRATWIRFVAGRPIEELPAAAADRFDTIIHGYFHGEICKLIGGRTVASPDDVRARIVENVQLLIRFMKRLEPGQKNQAVAGDRRKKHSA